MKLALKFTLAFVMGMCCVLAVYGYSISQREILSFDTDLRRDQAMLGYVLALALRQEWEMNGEEAALEFVEQANRSETGSVLRVRWTWLDAPTESPFHPLLSEDMLARLRDGNIVAWVDPAAGGFGRIYTYVPVRVANQETGAVEVSEPLAEQRLYTRTTIINVLLATVAAAVLSAMLALILGFRFVGHPVSRLIERAREIAAGNLDARLHFRQHDELRELAEEINTMCDQLSAARDRLAAETSARIATIEQLRHADRLKTVGQLASGIAHELGTPLNVVNARARMISSAASGDEPVASNAQIIAAQCDRMTKIIRQLLDFARPRTPRRARVDLYPLIESMLNLMESMARKGEVDFALEKGEDPCIAEVDPNQIQQVLSNLIVNGIQAMPSGGKLTVGVRKERVRPPVDHGGAEDEYICLFVQDEGAGIPEEQLPRLFEPFFTTKQVGQGTGLGLSVSRGIVSEHGGWIRVSSQVGRGSCFSIYLPLRSPDGDSGADR